VLHNLDLAIEPGETVAFVGPTGSGKSTAALLLSRFYDVTAGTLRIDGTDVRDFSLTGLRSQVGFVFQEPFLFSDTVHANIAYGRPGAGREEVEKAAREARIHDTICRLEAGYDTVIGERGITLSGGQKQRMTLARAVLLDPPILVLDDCTSSLDAVTEKGIREAMEAVAAKRTTVIIAQRVSTVKRADRIVVFDKGRIVQIGRHDGLIGQEGVYRDLFASQSFFARREAVVPQEAQCSI
jgi:ATP-binding cassette subfamily B protein